MKWWGQGPEPHVRWPGVVAPIRTRTRGSKIETADGEYFFDSRAADFAANFFPQMLRHHIGSQFAGKPFDLMPYQSYIVRAAFGWKRRADAQRRFRKVFLAVPKGSGKSVLASGLGLLLAFFDGEPGAEAYVVAGDRKQARIVFDTSKAMIRSNADLAAHLEIYVNSIKRAGSTDTFQVLSSESGLAHGLRPHGIVFDELHVQPNRDLFDALARGLGKRDQPMLVMITTAGDDDESICAEEWEYAKKVIADPSLDESYLPMVFAADVEDDWTSPEVWKRANPAYGVTVKGEYLANECRAAQTEPRKRNSFLQLYLNRWVNSATAWIPVEWWDACPSRQDESLLKTLPCSAGLDMAQKIDLAAFVVTFREQLKADELHETIKAETETGAVVEKQISLNYRIHVLPMFWMPENTLRERERSDRVPYSQWVDQGWVTATEGDVIDYDRIYRDILALAVKYPMLKQGEIGFDPAFATDIATKLMAEGFKMVEVPQNYRNLSEPSQVCEALVKSGRVVHNGNRCMRWCVENASVKTDDGGRIRPVKPKRAAKRIDGIVAAIMGIGRIMTAEPVMEATYEVTIV